MFDSSYAWLATPVLDQVGVCTRMAPTRICPAMLKQHSSRRVPFLCLLSRKKRPVHQSVRVDMWQSYTALKV